MLVQLGHESRRNLGGALVLSSSDADESSIVVLEGQALLVWTQGVQQPADDRVGKLFVRQPLKGGELPPARRRAGGRHVGGLVPVQDRSGRREVVDLKQPHLQFPELRIHRTSNRAGCRPLTVGPEGGGDGGPRVIEQRAGFEGPRDAD